MGGGVTAALTQDPCKWARRGIGRLPDEIGPPGSGQDPTSPDGTWPAKRILVPGYCPAAGRGVLGKNFRGASRRHALRFCMLRAEQADAHNGMPFPGSPPVAALRPGGKRYTKYPPSDSGPAVDAYGDACPCRVCPRVTSAILRRADLRKRPGWAPPPILGDLWAAWACRRGIIPQGPALPHFSPKGVFGTQPSFP